RVADRTEALQESEARHRTLAESLPQLIWTCDATDAPTISAVSGRNTPAYRKPSSSAITGASRFIPRTRRKRSRPGRKRWPADRSTTLSSGSVIKWFGSNTDIDDIRSAELRIQAQLERLRLLHQITRAIGERQDLDSI